MIEMDNCASRPLRVCHLISSFRPIIGGAERATEQLTATLRQDGVDVIVLTRRQSRDVAPFEIIGGVPVYRLGLPDRNKLSAFTYALHGFWLLATRFRSYDLVHLQNPDTPLLLGMLTKILFRKKLFLTIHGESLIYGYSRNFLGRLRLKIMAHLVDCFTSISPEVKEQLCVLGIPVSRIVLIPNGIDIVRFSPADPIARLKNREKFNLPISSPVVMFLGRLVTWKRVDLLLRAWACVSSDFQAQLLIVGTGPELDQLMALADNLHINVRFDGPTDDVVSYLHAADVFVLPSGIRSTASYEGLSVALMEAMSTGLAVLATDCPGNRVLIQDGDNGLLFLVEDVGELAKQLERLLEDPLLRARLGQNARASVYHEYAVDMVAQKTKSVYDWIRNTNGGAKTL